MSNSNISGNDLEKRLITFAVNIIVISNNILSNYTGNHLRHQLIRSGTSPALNYAEARFAESKKDFIHKSKVVLKELHETKVCIMLIMRSGMYKGPKDLNELLEENGELVAIFITSVNTAQKSLKKT